MADPMKRQTGAQNFHVSDEASREDEGVPPGNTESSSNSFVRWTLVGSEFDRLLSPISASESGATVMGVNDDEASSRINQSGLFAETLEQPSLNIARSYGPSPELESSYRQALLRLREVRDSFHHEEQKSRVDDVSIQFRIWGNEIWGTPGYSNILTQDYPQEAYAMNVMIDLMNQSMDAIQASSDDEKSETLLDSLNSCVDDLCDVSESLRMREKIRAKTDPVTKLKARLPIRKTLPEKRPVLSDNTRLAGQTHTLAPLPLRTKADDDLNPDQDDILANVGVEASSGPQMHIHTPDKSRLESVQGLLPPSINIDSQHAPAHTMSNSHHSAISFQPMRNRGERGESQYEHFHSDQNYPLVQPPKSGKIEDLQVALYAEQVSTEGGKRDLYKCFFPRGSLDQLITPQIVYESISESIEKGKVKDMDPDKIQQYAKRICGGTLAKSFKKMFAILLLADAPWLIIDFVDEDLNDSDLPLRIDPPSDRESFRRSLYRKSWPGKPIQCLEKWSIPGRTSFYSYQWTTIALFFGKSARRGVDIYRLSEEGILPWTKKYDLRAYGGYSEVYRVAIHKSHHDFGNREYNDGTFAVKKLRYEEIESSQSGSFTAASTVKATHNTGTLAERAMQRFRDEVAVLERFSDDAHPHLISLLAAFQKGRSCYLLFDWANSDLLHFWKHTIPGPPLEEKNVKWLIDQMRGISDGLYRIHTYRLSSNGADELTSNSIYGRHGDIKPQNFLIFKKKNQPFQESVIKLTDFGLTRFHSETSRSGSRQSNVAGFTPSYRPPELDLEGATISRSFDIWSLGCVFLEFVTWYFGGWSYVHDFVVKRMRKDTISGHKTDQFFEFIQDEKTEGYGLRIKPEVLKWISELHMRDDCSDLMHDLLEFIEKRMLAVIPPSQNTDRLHARASIEEVLESFRSFKNKASEASYSLMGHSKTTYIDESVISVDKPLEKVKNSGYFEKFVRSWNKRPGVPGVHRDDLSLPHRYLTGGLFSR